LVFRTTIAEFAIAANARFPPLMPVETNGPDQTFVRIAIAAAHLPRTGHPRNNLALPVAFVDHHLTLQMLDRYPVSQV